MYKGGRTTPCDVLGNPLPLGGGTPMTPATATATTNSSTVVASNSARKGLIVMNLGTTNVHFGCGSTALLNSGITLNPNGVWIMDQYTFTTSAINAIVSTGTATLAIQEYN